MKRNVALLVALLLASALVLGFSSNKQSGIETPADSIWVQKPDGSQQCSAESAQALEAGAKELGSAKIPVLNSRKGDDGKMRVQMCGAPTGKQNAYLIRKADWPRAMTLGFQAAKTAE